MKKVWIHTFLIVVLLTTVLKAQVPDSLEFKALKALYENTDGANWTNNTGWPTAGNWPATATATEMSTWYGITVTNGDVTYVILPNNGLSGALPESIGNLAELRMLLLNNNQILGNIPISLGELLHLNTMFLYSNLLTGNIPVELGNLAELVSLQLHDNVLTGTIPSSLGNCTKLEYFYIRNANMSGSIPASFENLTKLKVLFISDCGIGGELPSYLGNFPDMYYIYLYRNNFTGSIPENWQNLSSLQHLILRNNQLSGTLPLWLRDIPNLVSVSLGNNSLIGNINEFIGDWPNLTTLNLSGLDIEGKIPESIGNLTKLQSLYLNSNNFIGELPSNFNKLTLLKYCYLNNNTLSGQINMDFNGMAALRLVFVNSNNFTSFPDLTEHPNATNLKVAIGNNNIPYSSIEANLNIDGTHNFKTFTYSTQGTVTPTDSPTAVLEGTQLIIDTHDASPNNTFVWEKQSGTAWTDETALNENPTGDKFVKTATADDAGMYRYTVTNSLLNQTKTSEGVEITTIHPKQYFLSQWAFQYKYDGRKRMVEKQVPGAGAVFMVYDNRDRLVLTQDSLQRAQNQWLFTKYDAFNRPVATGIYINASTREDMQTIVNSFYTNLQAGQAWYESSGSARHHYDNKSFPQTPLAEDYLTLTYYDDYMVADTWAMDYQDPQLTQTTNAVYSTPTINFDRVKGQVTASMVKNLNDNNWLKTVMYYDDRYRVIQTVANNHLGGVDRMSNLYDFTGKVLQTKTTHTDGTDTNTILHTNQYDHAGRLLNVKQKLNTEDEIVLLANNYNELGELIEKNLHSEDNGASFAQSVDYRYNIRGWLTSINDNNLSDGEGDYFGIQLLYNNQDVAIGNTSLFNGNISAVKWTSGVAGSEQQAYTYGYDPMNRITNATSKKLDVSWLPGATNMSVGAYDLNGNILSLSRNTFGSTMDNLTYDYTASGNQLQKVTDAGDITKGFKDGNTTGNDYEYDGNGNLTVDKNKDITAIEYNHLNLPSKVTKGTGEYIKYSYDAAGIKLAQEVYNAADELQKRTDYAGAYIYENDTLQFIQTAEGRIIVEEGTPEYQYHLKDHLGNTRVSFTTKDEVDTYLATMETEYRTYETATFTNIEETDKQDQLFNNTVPDANVTIPAYSAMLNSVATQIMGPAKSISVAPGDVINLEVWAKYATASYNGNGDKVLANTVLAAIAGAFTPIGATAEVAQQIIDQFTAAGAGALSPAANTDAPAAYLNYLLFDANYILIQSGFEGVTTTAEGAFEKLETIPPVSITEPGYLYIYVSNEDAANVNVYFDDLKITHTKSKIVQMDSYYPFGLTFNSFQRSTGTPNNYLYNEGTERIFDLDLGVDMTSFRVHDPSLGRWWQIDPIEKVHESGYAWVTNNPIRFNDPLGLDTTIVGSPLKEVIITAERIPENKRESPNLAYFRKNYYDPSDQPASGAVEPFYFVPNPLEAAISTGYNISEGEWVMAAMASVALIPGGKTIRGVIKAVGLPVVGKIRFIPRKGWNPTRPLTKGPKGGYLDRFGNEWTKKKVAGKAAGEIHWDVQLSPTGKSQLGHLSNSGSHLNVTPTGKIAH